MFRSATLAIIAIGAFVYAASASTTLAQCATCATPYTTYSPVKVQAYQPVVPSQVVVQQPRRCCLQRFCDWICGRDTTTVVSAPPVMQAATYAPCNTCPPPACSTCPPTGYGSCSACGTSPCSCGTAPALSYLPGSTPAALAPNSAYATAYATPYAASYAPAHATPYGPTPATPYASAPIARTNANAYYASHATMPVAMSQPRSGYVQQAGGTVQPSTMQSYDSRTNYAVPATYMAPSTTPSPPANRLNTESTTASGDRLAQVSRTYAAGSSADYTPVAARPLPPRARIVSVGQSQAPRQNIGWTAGRP